MKKISQLFHKLHIINLIRIILINSPFHISIKILMKIYQMNINLLKSLKTWKDNYLEDYLEIHFFKIMIKDNSIIDSCKEIFKMLQIENYKELVKASTEIFMKYKIHFNPFLEWNLHKIIQIIKINIFSRILILDKILGISIFKIKISIINFNQSKCKANFNKTIIRILHVAKVKFMMYEDSRIF